MMKRGLVTPLSGSYSINRGSKRLGVFQIALSLTGKIIASVFWYADSVDLRDSGKKANNHRRILRSIVGEIDIPI